MGKNVIFILQILITFQSLFFVFYLLTGKHREFIRNQILSALMLITALIMIMNWISEMGIPFPNLNLVLGLSIGPVLYLFAKSLIYKKFKISYRNYLHFIPFVIALLTLFVIKLPLWVYANSIFLSFIIYIIFSFTEIYKYQRFIKNIDANYDRISLGWLKQFLWMVLLIIGVNSLGFWTQTNFTDLSYSFDTIILFVLLFFLISSVVFKALKQPQIFIDFEDSKIQDFDIKIKPSDFLSIEKRNEYFNKISDVMEKKQPYFNPNFLITDLAKIVKLPHKIVSHTINNHVGKNFSDFVNEYRVEAIKNLLSHPVPSDKTILHLMYEVGFNTKSNFNRAFKKFTGTTPSQYKKVFENN